MMLRISSPSAPSACALTHIPSATPSCGSSMTPRYFCTVWSQPTALADQRAPQYLPAERAMMYTTPMSTSTP